MLVTTLKYLMNAPHGTDLIGATSDAANFFLINLILESSFLLGAKPVHVVCQQQQCRYSRLLNKRPNLSSDQLTT